MSTSLLITEIDESGDGWHVYGHPSSSSSKTKSSSSSTKPLLQQLITVFLPAGYPTSVTDDYIGYQIYDSLQAFSSSIAGLLSSRAVLQGFGVGDANASATNALLLTVLQDSIGRLATILFAHKFGIALEAECKMYRFLADIFNDSAMVLDTLSPLFPGYLRVSLLCTSGMLRALCGVAGGASKTSLSVHFAKTGNVAELDAKDSSQETVISLMGMLAGSFIVSHVTSSFATWVLLLSLLVVHLGTNFKAVSCVAFRTFSRQRANIVIGRFHRFGQVLTPKQVSLKERIITKPDVLRWNEGSEAPIGTCDVGVRFATLLDAVKSDSGRQADDKNLRKELEALATIFQDEKYLLWPKICRPEPLYPIGSLLRNSFSPSSTSTSLKMLICVKEGARSTDLLKAWYHSLLLAVLFDETTGVDTESKLVLIQLALRQVEQRFIDLVNRLQAAGWNLNISAFETQERYRIRIGASVVDPKEGGSGVVGDAGEVDEEETRGRSREKKRV